MKVWLVFETSGQGEPDYMYGVYASREKAEKVIREMPNDWKYNIEEHGVEE